MNSKLALPLTSNSTLILKAITVFAAILAVYHQDLQLVFFDALQNEATNQALLVLPIFGFLLYLKRKMLRAVTSRAHNLRLRIGSYTCRKYCTVGGFMVTRRFTVVLEAAEEGGFVVKCLELPVATQGETREEALKNIKEAIEGYLEVKAKLLHGKIRGERVEVVVEAPSALLA